MSGTKVGNAKQPCPAKKRKISLLKVEGPSKAKLGETLTYKITKFDVADPTPEEKSTINWIIKEGKKTIKTCPGWGDTLEYKPEVMGQVFTVMPYFKAPSSGLSVKTEVRKIAIEKVEGPAEANAGTTASYKVSKLSVADPTDEEKSMLRWVVELDRGTEEPAQRGLTLNYEAVFGNQTIKVMPYFIKPEDKFSVKTKIIATLLKFKSPEEGKRYDATEDALFPDLTAEVTLEGVEKVPEISWNVRIDYDVPKAGTKARYGKTYIKKSLVFANNPWLFEGKGTAKTWKPFEHVKEFYGGFATFRAEATIKGKRYGDQKSFILRGKNPGEAKIKEYIRSYLKDQHKIDDETLSDIMVTIVYQESYPKWCQFFDDTGEVVVSFDYGFGMTQITLHPTPTIEQVWSWKRNIEGAITDHIRPSAIKGLRLLTKHKPFKYEHLAREIWTRYNAGEDSAYHKWDDEQKQWVCAQPNLLCREAAGDNVGWDSTKVGSLVDVTLERPSQRPSLHLIDPSALSFTPSISMPGQAPALSSKLKLPGVVETEYSNAGKTVAELNKRDFGPGEKEETQNRKKSLGLWGYYGICYANNCLKYSFKQATGKSFPDKEFPETMMKIFA